MRKSGSGREHSHWEEGGRHHKHSVPAGARQTDLSEETEELDTELTWDLDPDGDEAGWEKEDEWSDDDGDLRKGVLAADEDDDTEGEDSDWWD